MPYVVESPVTRDGTRIGTARVYVATEARAQEIVAALPSERTYREIAENDLPANVPVPRMNASLEQLCDAMISRHA